MLVKPRWETAKTKARSKKAPEVVETNISSNVAMLMTDEKTTQMLNLGGDEKAIRNVSRMVFLKDEETGEMKNFIMTFVGSYEYLAEGNSIGKNTYLKRQKNFDGSVFFFTTEGEFINGWKYDKGAIVGSIYKQTPIDSLGMETKAMETRCYTDCYTTSYYECDEYYAFDAEWGMISMGQACTSKTDTDCYETCNSYWVPDYDDNDDDHYYIPEGNGNVGGVGNYEGDGKRYTGSHLLDRTLAEILPSKSKVAQEFERILAEGRIKTVTELHFGHFLVEATKNSEGKYEYSFFMNSTSLDPPNGNTAKIIVAHELYHLYSFERGVAGGGGTNDYHHQSMIYDNDYKDFLKEVLPGFSNENYESLKYAGTTESPVYQELPNEQKMKIEGFFKDHKIVYK